MLLIEGTFNLEPADRDPFLEAAKAVMAETLKEDGCHAYCFSPDIIDYLSQQLSIPKNLMFVTCPNENFSHKIETLGGVRLITH